MANTQAISASFLSEMLVGNHQLGSVTLTSRTSLTAPTTDTIKAALYLASATINKSTTAYTATGEVANSGTYAAGGATVTNATAPTNDGTTAYWTPSAALSWTGVTATSFDTVLFYNSTQSNKAIANYNFGSQTVVAGNITLNMPTNNGTTGLLRFA
jgi:2-oxoglutarate dehydrogenase complex dehydrogenase (E1) component-like enzyme